jgi:hypothetical protein
MPRYNGSLMNERLLNDRFASAFRTSTAVCIFIIAASLAIFVSPLAVLVPLAAVAFLWMPFHSPVSTLGVVLAFMPFDFMAIALGKFYGLPQMTLVSACDKEVILLLLTFILWRQNGFKPTAPDWFLLASFTLAVLRTAFGGTLVGLVTDFAFIIPYFVGRVTVLTSKQEHLWARRAVWIVGILAVLGLVEVFILGEGPRTLLYLATGSETEAGQLTSSFHAAGLTGPREAATTGGPNGFGAFCMVALIIWWVYCRNPLPAAMIAVGLICSVTRSAWVGTAAAIPLLAITTQQKKRLVLYAALALGLFVMSIPVLGLSEYLVTAKTGQDLSAEGHRDQILDGLQYAADHPFGSGNGKVGPLASKEVSNAPVFETTYPALAAEYGIAPVLCLVGFLFSAIYLAWREQSQLGYVAVGILVGISLVMIFTLPLTDRRLASWALFPIGLAVRSAIDRARATTPPSRLQTILENP